MTGSPTLPPYIRESGTEVFVYAFDLLELDGEDMKRTPLLDRKAPLPRILSRSRRDIVLNDHDAGDGEALFNAACKMGLEGIVSKRAASSYTPGRARCWVKTKNPLPPAMMRLAEDM